MDLINKEIWDKIEKDLGEITDFEITLTTDSTYTPVKINYKSNGIPQTIYLSDLKMWLHSLTYCCEAFNLHRKYKRGS